MTRKITLSPRKVEELASRGLSQFQIAHALGISHDTLTARKQDTPSIASALNRGRTKIAGELINLLVEQARAGNVAATIFALKNLAGWTDRTTVDIDSNTPLPLVIALPSSMAGQVPESQAMEGEVIEVIDEAPEPERPRLSNAG